MTVVSLHCPQSNLILSPSVNRRGPSLVSQRVSDVGPSEVCSADQQRSDEDVNVSAEAPHGERKRCS